MSARGTARILWDRAQAGDLDAAHVLVDVLATSRKPRLGEDLLLALSGRMWHGPRRGEPLDPREHGAWLREALAQIGPALFPKACMPRLADVREIVATAAHVHLWEEYDYNVGVETQRIWGMLQRACAALHGTEGAKGRAGIPEIGGDEFGYVDDALDVANEVLSGFGVAQLAVDTVRSGLHVIEYVDLGELNRTTIAFPHRTQRFQVMNMSDVRNNLTRRFGTRATFWPRSPSPGAFAGACETERFSGRRRP